MMAKRFGIETKFDGERLLLHYKVSGMIFSYITYEALFLLRY